LPVTGNEIFQQAGKLQHLPDGRAGLDQTKGEQIMGFPGSLAGSCGFHQKKKRPEAGAGNILEVRKVENHLPGALPNQRLDGIFKLLC